MIPCLRIQSWDCNHYWWVNCLLVYCFIARHSSWQLQSWTHSMKSHTKTAHWSCSFSETIWRCVNHWLCCRITQTNISVWNYLERCFTSLVPNVFELWATRHGFEVTLSQTNAKCSDENSWCILYYVYHQAKCCVRAWNWKCASLVTALKSNRTSDTLFVTCMNFNNRWTIWKAYHISLLYFWCFFLGCVGQIPTITCDPWAWHCAALVYGFALLAISASWCTSAHQAALVI